ncbi:hypothetical protein V2O64_22840 [Verrucomicrobiaceae bacterium 227]
MEYANGYREEELVWRTWGRLDGESALKASLEVRPWISEYVLSSFGEENPARALELIDEYQIEARIAEDRDVLKGIMKGLARVDPREALEFARVKGHAGMGREVAVQFSLESPMEMLELALPEEEFFFGVSLDDLAGIAAEANPEAVRSIADLMPTGSRKATLLEGVANAASGSVEHRRLMESVSSLPARSDFLELLAEAREVHPSKFQSWFNGDQKIVLNDYGVDLIRRVIRYRWADQAPEEYVRFMVARGDFDLVDGFERWLEVDESVALGFPASLNGSRDSGVRSVGLELVRAIGREDVVTALMVGCGY